MDSIRAAIIGCGPGTAGRGGAHSIAYAHALAMQRSGEVTLVAAASRNEQNRRDFATVFPGTSTYADYGEMLAEVRPELVSICAFPPDREAMARAALAAGASILWIEKPFAADHATALRIAEDARRHRARIFVNHQRRYGLPFAEFRAAVTGGGIGELLGVDVVQPTRFLMDFGPHLVDVALSVLGPRRALRVLAAVDRSHEEIRQGMPVESAVIATVHFEGGLRLTLESGVRTPTAMPIVRAQGSEGFAELHLAPPPGAPGVFRARLRGRSDVHALASDEGFHHSEDGNLYVDRALRDLLSAHRRQQPCVLDAEEALRGLEILDAVFASAKAGRTIELPASGARPSDPR